eukprot:g14107.t1
MKLALATFSAFALVSSASALRLVKYHDYISQDSSLPHCNSDVFEGGYGYPGAKCGCLDHEKKTNGRLVYKKRIGPWEVPYYEVKCEGQQFDEEMDSGENVGYGHNPWGPDGQYNGRGVNSHSFSNPQGGVRGNSFSQSFDEEMDSGENVGYGHNPWGPDGQYNGRGVNSHSFSNPQGGVRGNSFSQSFDSGRLLRGGRCYKKPKCKFTDKFCQKNFGKGYFPAKRSPEECCPSMCLQQMITYRL